METLAHMLATTPNPPQIATSRLAGSVKACLECEAACLSCADACLGEPGIDTLRRCIRLDLDCAEICSATARLLARQYRPDVRLLRAMVEACAVACAACATECEWHGLMEHCGVCAEACRRCEAECHALLGSLPTQ
jgi:hypothetical protein